MPRPFVSLCSLAAVLWLGAAAPAVAAEGPLRPAPTWPTWDAALLDVAIPAAVSAGVGLAGPSLVGSLGGNAGAYLWLATMAVLPPAALVRWHDPAFPLDDALAATTGGLAGAALGYLLVGRLLAAPTDPASAGLGAGIWGLAAGQGLGAALGYHAFRVFRDTTAGLDELPAHRTDDPIENWDYGKERRHP